MTVDYYSILELKEIPKPSDDDILRAYRRLTMRYHPDRNKGMPAATEKFHLVAKAWEVLGNPEERGRYDAKREKAKANPITASKNPTRGFVDRLRKRGDTIRIELPVKLKEMIFGGQRTVQFPRSEPCPSCGGAGSHPKADGACGKCGGGGMVNATANVTIKIRPGVRPGEEMVFPNIGTFSSGNGLPGDVRAVVTLGAAAGIELLGDAVRQTVIITTGQAQRGVEMRIILPDGNPRRIKVPPGMQSGTLFKLAGRGLPGEKGVRGDYILRFGVWIPGPNDDLEGDLIGAPADAMRQVLMALDGAAASLDPLSVSGGTAEE